MVGVANQRVSQFSTKDWELDNPFETINVKPTMSLKRLLGTVVSLLLGLFLCYCSLFYVPAYFSKDQIVRVSTDQDVVANLSGEEIKAGWFTPYLDLLRVKRGYFKAGQTIEAEYVLSKPNDLTIVVTRCSSLAIFEIFDCKPVETLEYVQANTERGRLKVRAPTTGFYNVSEYLPTDAPEELRYAVIWRRR